MRLSSTPAFCTQVQLGGLEADDVLREAQELLESDMHKPRHTWCAP